MPGDIHHGGRRERQPHREMERQRLVGPRLGDERQGLCPGGGWHDLYAGGYFTTAGGVSANRIAKWNGSAWSALGSGMNGSVNALAVSGATSTRGGLHHGGRSTANRIAKWNGSAWSALGSGMNEQRCQCAGGDRDGPLCGRELHHGRRGERQLHREMERQRLVGPRLGNERTRFNALAVSGTDLYAGGDFTTAGGVSANRIAKWNGSAWSAPRFGDERHRLLPWRSGTDLYAGGYFTTAGGVSASRIAKWNGSAWSALGSGMNDAVYCAGGVRDRPLRGGAFTTAGGVSANNIAKWNGSAWSALGSGMNDNVSALAVPGRTSTPGDISPRRAE